MMLRPTPRILFLFAPLALAQNPTGSISGTVLDAITHQPVVKATVHFDMIDARPAVVLPKSIATDPAGSFTLPNLEPGKYSVSVRHVNYPDDANFKARKTIEIKAGEKAAPISIELIPGASITGHVVDEDGDPMGGCMVQASPRRINTQGYPFRNATASPEDGSFRMYGVPPGKYILYADCRQPAFQIRPLSAGPDRPPTAAYPPQFYPFAADIKSAQPVELFPGSEKAGVEFQMRTAPVTQINGVFTSAVENRIRPILNVRLVPVDEHSPWRDAGTATINWERLTFQFPLVFPGSYALIAFATLGGSPENQVGAFQRVDVKNTAVEVALDLRPAMTIRGTVEIEASNTSGPGSEPLTLNHCSVELASESPIGWGNTHAEVEADGTFVLNPVFPGLWRIRVHGPGAFLKSAWLGTTEVTKSVLDLTSGSAGDLKLRISNNTPILRGTGPPGQMIFALNLEDMANGSNGAIVDQSGQFTLEHLAPGTYRIVASAPGGPPPDEGGQEVTLHEGETTNIDVKPSSN